MALAHIRYRWRIRLTSHRHWLGQQFGEGRATRLGARPLAEPRAEAQEVQPRRGQDVAEVRFRLADVACATQATGPDAARERALDTRAPGVGGREVAGLLALPGGLEGVVFVMGADGDRATRIFPRARTERAAGAGAAVAPGELDLDDVVGA